MSAVLRGLERAYAALLGLYPPRFRAEFGVELQGVFAQALDGAARRGWLSLATFCAREIGDFPAALLREYWSEMAHTKEKWTMSEKVEHLEKPGIAGAASNEIRSTAWEALAGALPFLAFGLASMLVKLDLPFHGGYPWLAFYPLALLGLLAGWVMGFPRWSYGYLGWVLIFAWWWTSMATNGLRIFGYTFRYNELWGWRIWLPLAVTAGLALLWTRSLAPLKKLVADIWQDWTRLLLASYTFLAWFGMIYDENHHPYLLAFMLATTLAFSAGAWAFLRSASPFRRVLSLVASITVAVVLVEICEATWDWRAYYGLPMTVVPWHMTVLRWIAALAMLGAILFWPALVGLARRVIHARRVA